MATAGLPMPSSQRVEPGSVNVPLGTFPKTAISKKIDASKIANELIATLNTALSQKDYDAISSLFFQSSYFRSHLALTWALRTLKGRDNIIEFLKSARNPPISVQISTSTAFRSPTAGPIDAWGDVQGVQFFVEFETAIGKGEGTVRLAEVEQGKWAIFTMALTLTELKEYLEPVGERRVQGVQHGGNPDRKTWLEGREEEKEFVQSEPAAVIIGAGQGGLTAAARLKMLGVPTLIIDKNVRVGDNWRKRYKQLVLHDPVWYDHLPYIPFPAHWPVFTPKDKLGEFFEAYVKLMELNVWTSTTLTSSTWDGQKKEWNITISRNNPDGTTTTRTLHPHHLIQATGHSGEKNLPQIPGLSIFQGRVYHSSEFPGAAPQSPSQSPKRVIVVGSCNSAHDIAQDYHERGYAITMIQRSTTLVVSSSAIVNIALKGLYDESGPPVSDADLFLHGIPSELFKAQQVKVTGVMAKHDAATREGLEKAGFRLDNGPMDAGLLMKYFQRGGGYYIDVGASQLIIDGKIKIKSGVEITKVLPTGVEFSDGTKLDADEIVFATGYQNMRTQTRRILGEEVAERVESVWGLNVEGEFRTMWQRSGHPGLWFMGGNLALCRYYSRILALQIKAVEVGLMD